MVETVRIVNRAVALWDDCFCFATLCNSQQRNELQSSRSGSEKKVPIPCSPEKDKMIRASGSLGIGQIKRPRSITREGEEIKSKPSAPCLSSSR